MVFGHSPALTYDYARAVTQMIQPMTAFGRRAAVSSLFGAGSKLVGVGLAFAVLLVFARHMDPVAFGVYSVGVSVANLVWPVAAVGQPMIALRFVPVLTDRYGSPAGQYVMRRGLLLVGAGSVLIVACAAIIAVMSPHLEAAPTVWTGAFAGMLALSQFACFALRAQADLAWSLIPRDVMWRLGLIGGAIWLGEMSGAVSLALSCCVLGVMTMAQVMRLAMVRDRAGIFATASLPVSELSEIRRAQWGLWGGSIAGQWLQYAGTVVVALCLGPVQAGAFFAAQRLANLLSLALVGSNQVTGPMIARDWHAGRRVQVQMLVHRVALLTGAAALIGVLIYCTIGSWMLTLFDPAYDQAFYALIVLGCAQVVNAACGPNGNLLNLAGEERSVFYITVACGLLNICFVALGAVVGDITGAAIGASLGLILWNLWASNICAQRLGVQGLLARGQRI